jgi:hypothetical protein
MKLIQILKVTKNLFSLSPLNLSSFVVFRSFESDFENSLFLFAN